MKKVKIRVVALLLSCCLAVLGTVGSYERVQAAEVVAGMGTLEWLYTLFMSAGFTAGAADLLNQSSDEELWNYWDEWHKLPNQKQLDEAEEKISKLYYGSTEAYKKNHSGGSPSPTPVPSQIPDPPVTVKPVNPEDLEPLDWATIKQKTDDTGFLVASAATTYCLKEAIKGWWDDIIQPVTVEEGLPENVVNEIVSSGYPYYYYGEPGHLYLGGVGSFRVPSRNFFNACSPSKSILKSGQIEESSNSSKNGYLVPIGSNMPAFNTIDEGYDYMIEARKNAENRPPKSTIWPSIDLKDSYDKNQSPSYPEVANPPAIRVPTIQEIRDLNKQGTDDEENRPTYVTNFITNHTVQATPTPEPTKKPDAQPTPTIAVAPGSGGDTKPDAKPTTTPAVAPDPGTGGGTDPKPTGSPGTGGGTGTDPENPDKPDDSEIADYKTDLRLVFPFCIPFDLIHLLEAFDAEPEAPVFKIPIDLQVENPFTGSKIVDFQDEIVIDLSDYEQAAKIVRILEVIAFLVGLMLITRQQMIKG